MMIHDQIRKKWIILTPEEWVRQHLIHYLITEKNYPASTLAIEKMIELNDVKKRFDLVAYDNHMRPILLAECKAPYIDLSKDVLAQAERYNLVLNCRFFMITNGLQHFVFENNKLIEDLPHYK